MATTCLLDEAGYMVSIIPDKAYNTSMLKKSAIEARLRSASLPGLPKEKLVIPDYQGFCIDAIPDLACSLYGLSSTRAPLLNSELSSLIESGFKRVVLFVIDGLGYLYLCDLLDRFEDLYLHRLIRDGFFLPLTSVFPATTATALTTYSTGCTPQEHGMLGYRLYLKETGAITNMVRLSLLGNSESNSAVKAGMDLDTFLGVPTMYEKLSAMGVQTHLILSRHIASSGLSSILYKSVDRVSPAVSLSDMLVIARRALEQASDRVFVSLYWGAMDAIAHTYGPGGEELVAEFRAIDAALERELKGSKDTLLILCADHGFVGMEEPDYLSICDYPELEQNLVMPPVGETRASYLFVKTGKKAAVAGCINKNFAADIACIDSRDALAQGLFGLGEPGSRIYDRIGDLIALSTGKRALYYPYKNGAKLRGMHGGMTPQEMLVPLIACPL